jgi:hypothetical protein
LAGQGGFDAISLKRLHDWLMESSQSSQIKTQLPRISQNIHTTQHPSGWGAMSFWPGTTLRRQPSDFKLNGLLLTRLYQRQTADLAPRLCIQAWTACVI